MVIYGVALLSFCMPAGVFAFRQPAPYCYRSHRRLVYES
jgi:hypothetical protein